MGQTALSCVRPSSTPKHSASSPDHLSSMFKASLKTRRSRSSYILSAPSSTRLMNRATSLSIDHRNIQYASRTPANKAAMASGKKFNESNNRTKNDAEDLLEMNGFIVRERPSTDDSSISISAFIDDDEAFCTSTRCTIIPNTTLQFTKVSPVSSESVSPRTVLAFLMTSNHSKEQSMDLSNSESLDKILREHQIVAAIDQSTSQEHDSDSETDDEEYYDYDDAYYPYVVPVKTTRRHEYQIEKQQLDIVPAYRYPVRPSHEQLAYRRNSC